MPSTADQTHSSRIHGEDLVAAERLMYNPASARFPAGSLS